MQCQSSVCLERFCQCTNDTLYHLECNFITTITYRVGLALSLRTFVENRISGTGAMGRLLRLGLVVVRVGGDISLLWAVKDHFNSSLAPLQTMHHLTVYNASMQQAGPPMICLIKHRLLNHF